MIVLISEHCFSDRVWLILQIYEMGMPFSCYTLIPKTLIVFNICCRYSDLYFDVTSSCSRRRKIFISLKARTECQYKHNQTQSRISRRAYAHRAGHP